MRLGARQSDNACCCVLLGGRPAALLTARMHTPLSRLLQLAALDFNPADSGLDITEDIFSEAPAAPVLTVPAPAPEPACLPMLHVAAPCHALDAEHVQKASAAGVWEGACERGWPACADPCSAARLHSRLCRPSPLLRQRPTTR